MNIGTVLVLVGTILAAIDFFFEAASPNGAAWYGNRRLLTLGVVLIGIGVLCGPEVLVNK